MTRIIYFFITILYFKLEASDNIGPQNRLSELTAYMVNSATDVPNLTTPIIDQAILARSGATSSEEFCTHMIRYLSHQNPQMQSITSSQLPPDTWQEIVFFDLLKWSQNFQKTEQGPIDVLNPYICFNTYYMFYHPLAILLQRGFRHGHLSQPILIDLCLHSLKAFSSLWNKSNEFSRHYMRNRFRNPDPTNPKICYYLEKLSQTIKSLKYYTPHLPVSQVGDAILPPPAPIKPDLKRTVYNYELHNMVKLNRKIESISYKNLMACAEKKSLQRTKLSRDEILMEMDKQDQFVDFLKGLARTLPTDVPLTNDLLIQKLQNWQSVMNLASVTLSNYPKYFDVESFPDQQAPLVLILLLKQLTPMAQYFLFKTNSSQKLDNILNKINGLEEIVDWAHRHLKKHKLPGTHQHLSSQVNYLEYLFRFTIDLQTDQFEDIYDLLDEMHFWEPVFNAAMQKLIKEQLLSNKNRQEINEILKKTMIDLFRQREFMSSLMMEQDDSFSQTDSESEDQLEEPSQQCSKKRRRLEGDNGENASNDEELSPDSSSADTSD